MKAHKNWLQISILIAFFVFMAFGFYGLYIIKSKAGQCLQNPLEYGVVQISEQVEELMCTCSFQKGNLLPFLVTANGTQPLEGPQSSSTRLQNFSISLSSSK